MNRAPDLQDAQLARLRGVVSRYQQPSASRALWQMANTLVPYLLLWWAMYGLREISLWLTAAIAVIAGCLLVRLFIIFHDCGHGSFFAQRWANQLVGFLMGALTFTPFHQWHRQHAAHHRTSGHLDKRGTGDIWTLTVREYRAASRWKRFRYRLARNPLVLFGIAPLVMFVFVQRIAPRGATLRARQSVLWMNLTLTCAVATMCWVFGAAPYLLIQGLVLFVAGALGVWLFYVQHQFEGAYWESDANWDPVAAALQGSSFYKLPRTLQWLTGNIGFHHIHHLGPAIPNYRLQACHESDPVFQRVSPITLATSLRSLGLRLWDEADRRLVSYASALAGSGTQGTGPHLPRTSQARP